jgi:hypothetical protein
MARQAFVAVAGRYPRRPSRRARASGWSARCAGRSGLRRPPTPRRSGRPRPRPRSPIRARRGWCATKSPGRTGAPGDRTRADRRCRSGSRRRAPAAVKRWPSAATDALPSACRPRPSTPGRAPSGREPSTGASCLGKRPRRLAARSSPTRPERSSERPVRSSRGGAGRIHGACIEGGRDEGRSTDGLGGRPRWTVPMDSGGSRAPRRPLAVRVRRPPGRCARSARRPLGGWPENALLGALAGPRRASWTRT